MMKTATHSLLRPQGGPLLKNLLATALTRLGQRPADIERDLQKINRRVPPSPGNSEHYNDSFVFQGSSPDHEMFMSRLAFRGDGDSAEVWVFLDLGGRKLVNLNPIVHGVSRTDTQISAGGLTYAYDPSADRWRITYDGPLDGADHCEIELEYRPRSAIYLSSRDMDPGATGKAMAEMPWNRAYFQKLGSERQVRMEQGGSLSGEVQLDGERRALELRAFRDHSWGKRDWSFLNRYLWTIISLQRPLHIDGEAYDYFCFTIADYGTSFRHLVAGWIAGPHHVRPIVAASDMGAIAAKGEIPARYPIHFQPKNGPLLSGLVTRLGVAQPWVLQNQSFEVNEAYCQVTLEGIDGQGMSELGFSSRCGIARPCFT